jgi:hypothetical protein
LPYCGPSRSIILRLAAHHASAAFSDVVSKRGHQFRVNVVDS